MIRVERVILIGDVLIRRSLAAVAAATLVATMAQPAMSAENTPSAAADPSLVQQMKSEAQGAVRISAEGATGRIGFVRSASGDLLPSADAGSAREAAAKAASYLDKYAAAFGARAGELRQSAVRKTVNGWTVEFTQSYRGVPVFAAELRAHVDAQGDLTAVNGFAVPDLDLDVSPRLSKADAATRAVDLVKAAPSDHRGQADVSGLSAVSNDLMVYRMGTTRGVEGESLLAWVIEVTNKRNVREMLILDARTGKPVNRWSMMAHATDRELYEADYDPANLVWSEGDDFPGDLDDDQSSEVLGAGETYWMFMNTFGRDSYDGEGAKMRTVNNDPSIRCPNANWNGTTTNYCSGVSSDDTVAHEWGHAYTEYTSGLIYQWQSGAMNEAYSDIWGETVDMLNDRMNADDARAACRGLLLDVSPRPWSRSRSLRLRTSPVRARPSRPPAARPSPRRRTPPRSSSASTPTTRSRVTCRPTAARRSPTPPPSTATGSSWTRTSPPAVERPLSRPTTRAWRTTPSPPVRKGSSSAATRPSTRGTCPVPPSLFPHCRSTVTPPRASRRPAPATAVIAAPGEQRRPVGSLALR